MRRQIRLEHVISFADAIFAFSITFMAISIQIPNLAQNLTQTQVINRLVELVPEFEILCDKLLCHRHLLDCISSNL